LAQVKSKALAPIGAEAFALEGWDQSGNVIGHDTALDPGHTPTPELVDAGLEERFPDIGSIPTWGRHKMSNHPEMPGYPITGVAYRLAIHSNRLTW
jgi:hypothetical protein